MHHIKRTYFSLFLLSAFAYPFTSSAVSLHTAAGAFVPPDNHSRGGQDLWGVNLDAVAYPDTFCLDGSQPLFYVDEAVNGPSNKWVFYFQGGGSCSTAQECADLYINSNERIEMSSHWASRSISGEGILNPNPAAGFDAFADYNRVKIKKCSYDRWMGNKSYSNVSATGSGGASLTFDLHFHGREIAKAVLSQLARGIAYHDETCSKGDSCRSLPPLENAEVVLLTGSSGGGKGLTHAVDDLAEEIRGIQAACANPPCSEAKIRGVVESAFMPGVDNEYRYSAQNPGGVMNFTSSATGLPATATFDLQIYSAPAGSFFADQEAWRDDRDSSCEAQHGPNHPLCEDHLHLLRYHVETPLFIRQDLQDPGSSHTNSGNGWTPKWAVSIDFPAEVNDYTNRVIAQANMYQGLMIDGIPVRIFSPTCRQHIGLIDNNAFYNHRLEDLSTGIQKSYYEDLIDWVTNPGTSAVIGVDDGIHFSTAGC